jgi:membrane-bound serine protease (ClpP class)
VVDVIRLRGVVGPAFSRYLLRGLDDAAHKKAQALVIELDTPGGLMTSMDEITKAMLEASVPTVVYIAPTGGRAASAGVFITYASNVAAMAPATHIGAAHPVAIGGGDKTELTKLTNDAAAQIRGFAVRRGRNAAWAERAVRESVSLTEDEALRLHVVDLIARDLPELLRKLDGRTVQLASGSRRLATAGAAAVEVPMDLSEQFLLLLSDPNIGLILLTIAMYGIIFELSNPGSVFPGVIGGLALILAIASFAVVAVNVAGLLFLAFAFILFIADIKVPSHGVLTTGGIASFVLGALLLTEYQAPFLKISLYLTLAIALLTAGFFAFIVGAGVRAQRRPVTTGPEALLDAVGIARSELAPSGSVFLDGALWKARAAEGIIPAGRPVRVLRVDGLRLTVQPADDVRPKEGNA